MYYVKYEMLFLKKVSLVQITLKNVLHVNDIINITKCQKLPLVN